MNLFKKIIIIAVVIFITVMLLKLFFIIGIIALTIGLGVFIGLKIKDWFDRKAIL